MNIRELAWIGIAWINESQDSDRWRALVNTVMNIRVPVMGKLGCLESVSLRMTTEPPSLDWHPTYPVLAFWFIEASTGQFLEQVAEAFSQIFPVVRCTIPICSLIVTSVPQ
jgi:hypothetical protein